MLLRKKMTQEKIVIFFSIFIIFTLNFKLLLFLFSEDFLLILSFLFLQSISLAIVFLTIAYRRTIKPVLIIFLLLSSVFTYFLHNFDMLLIQDIASENHSLIPNGFLWLINLKFFIYIFMLGLLPLYFLVKINLTDSTDLTFKNSIYQRIKVLLILILIFVLLALGVSRLIDFPLKFNNPVVVQLINISKAAIPLKNLILNRDIVEKIAILESQRSCSFCNLSNSNLNGKDLSGVDLSFAVLTGADLRNTNLSGSKLDGIDFSGIDLTGSNLTFADLTGAKLDEVELSNIDLNGTILNDVDLRRVDLTNQNLSSTILKRVNLKNVDLTGTSLSFAVLNDANLDGVDLSYKDLTGANLNNINLNNKDLTGTILSLANLTGASIDGVDLKSKDLTGTVLNNVDFRRVDLTNVNLSEAILKRANLSNSNLKGTILSSVDLTEANLSGVDLTNKDLSRANLSRVNLKNMDLTGANLTFANLEEANLEGVDLSNMNLTGVNLSRVDLSNKDLTNTILIFANLTGAILNGVDLKNKDLTGAILTGVDLSTVDMTGAILEGTQSIEIILKEPFVSNWPALTETQNLNVTRYDLSGTVEYLTTKEGLIFELRNNKSKLILDLKKDSHLPDFVSDGPETGLLGIAAKNEKVYITYTVLAEDGSNSLIVDEYSSNFKKVKNIIKIENFDSIHFGGNLLFDSLGSLYLSVGDGNQSDEAQNLNSLKGKILRLDTSESNLRPEIIAYGLRNPWGVSIDSKDRMFILQCGKWDSESVFLINEIYSDTPSNLGWPVFEGSLRKQKNSLTIDKINSPIFEYRNRPGCATAGVYLDQIESFLFADFFGTIRLLRLQDDGSWYLLHEDQKEKDPIWGFGYDKKTNKIFIAPNSRELEILVNQVRIN
jgi:uncharacterized protein YjbI with pentapeptide repeats